MPYSGTYARIKLTRYSRGGIVHTGRARWRPSGMRPPGGRNRNKLYWAHRRHPAFYRGRRRHPAFYRTLVARPYGAKGQGVGWQQRFGVAVCEYTQLDPVGTWTYGGLYAYQVPRSAPSWLKWERQAEARGGVLPGEGQGEGAA